MGWTRTKQRGSTRNVMANVDKRGEDNESCAGNNDQQQQPLTRREGSKRKEKGDERCDERALDKRADQQYNC